MVWKIRRRRGVSTMDSIEELVQRVVNNDPSTTEIVLKGLNIQQELMTSLAMALISNTHVKTLYLASVYIHSHSAQILASALVQNTKLETVWLEDNRICPAGASSFATALYVNNTIKTFALRNNLIGNEGALCILSAMQANKSVQSIVLDGNSIEYRLLAQIKELAARNMQEHSTKHKASSQSTTVPKSSVQPVKSKSQKPVSKVCKSASDCDHDDSISSWATLETIMEEPESEDDD